MLNISSGLNSLAGKIRRRLPAAELRAAAATVSEKPCFIQDARAAAEASAQLRAALAAGQLDRALQQALEAIAVQPGWAPAYQQLAEVLDRQGREEEALECFKGELPETVWREYSALAATRLSSQQPDCLQRRFIESPGPEEIILPPLHSCCAPAEPGSAPGSIKPAGLFVDFVRHGHAWHDAHITQIVDQHGGLIPEHSMGPQCLVNSLRRSHAAQYAGPRVFLLGARGISNYYHWMTDILPKLELCRLAGVEFRQSDRFAIAFQHRDFQLASLEKFGISPQQLYQTHIDSCCFIADELVVPYLKNTMATTMGVWLPAFLQRTFGVQQLPAEQSGRRLFVSRSSATTQGRWVENNAELERFMSGQGFEIVLPEQYSVDEQAALFSGAQLVVGPHGAGLSNIVFCHPGTTLIEFYGAHLSPCYRALSAILGMNYYQLQCHSSDSDAASHCAAHSNDSAEQARTKTVRKNRSYTVAIDDLAALLAIAGLN